MVEEARLTFISSMASVAVTTLRRKDEYSHLSRTSGALPEADFRDFLTNGTTDSTFPLASSAPWPLQSASSIPSAVSASPSLNPSAPYLSSAPLQVTKFPLVLLIFFPSICIIPLMPNPLGHCFSGKRAA